MFGFPILDLTRRYTYHGDKHTDQTLKGAICWAAINASGKCIRGRNGSMLVFFASSEQPTVILGKHLRRKPEVA